MRSSTQVPHMRYNSFVMRVLMLSKALIVGQYQTKLTALAAKPDMQLTVVVPPSWRDERGTMMLERCHTEGYELIVAPIRFNGHFHLHYYPTLPQILARVQPDVIHIDEEPYNLATYLATRAACRINPKARVLFFSWQNILKQSEEHTSELQSHVNLVCRL